MYVCGISCCISNHTTQESQLLHKAQVWVEQKESRTPLFFLRPCIAHTHTHSSIVVLYHVLVYGILRTIPINPKKPNAAVALRQKAPEIDLPLNDSDIEEWSMDHFGSDNRAVRSVSGT